MICITERLAHGSLVPEMWATARQSCSPPLNVLLLSTLQVISESHLQHLSPFYSLWTSHDSPLLQLGGSEKGAFFGCHLFTAPYLTAAYNQQ